MHSGEGAWWVGRERERSQSQDGASTIAGDKQLLVLAEDSIAFYIDLSDRLWWANGNGRLKAPKPELSIQPQGSLAASLAFLLGSLDAGPGGTAAPGALSLAPDFRLTLYRALQIHPLLSSAVLALDSLAFSTFSILSLQQARSCQSLNSQPSSPRPERAHPSSPQPPNPTSSDSSCSAETCPVSFSH